MDSIKKCDENIYSWDEKEMIKMVKPPRYKSRYRSQVVKEVRDSKSACKTMGYPIEQKDPPNWPKGSVENIDQNKDIALPARILSKRADARTVNINQLCRAGLQPVYVYQPTFGKVPNYLKRRIKEAASEDERCRAEEIRSQLLCQYVPRRERDAVLEGLRKNWQELQKNFQGLSIVTDTLSKKTRKMKLENKLKQLEKYILLIESHPHIYVKYEPDEVGNDVDVD